MKPVANGTNASLITHLLVCRLFSVSISRIHLVEVEDAQMHVGKAVATTLWSGFKPYLFVASYHVGAGSMSGRATYGAESLPSRSHLPLRYITAMPGFTQQ